MPYYWCGIDSKRAYLSALGSVSTALLGKYVVHNDKSLQGFLSQLRGPSFLPKCKYTYSALDVLTAAPFGYASYVVWFRGGGFDYTDTKIALGLYAANIVTGLSLIQTFKSKDVKKIACHTGILSLLALAATTSFFYIDRQAGYLSLPYTLWTAFCTYVTYCFYKNANTHHQ